jgi:transposase-like protein
VAVSVWIQGSKAKYIINEDRNTAAAGQDVSAKDRNHQLDASLSELFGYPIPYRDTVKQAAQELRTSQILTNSATQNAHVQQLLDLDFPEDAPQIHSVHKRVLPEFRGDAPSNNDRYDNKFPRTNNAIQAEIHNRKSDKHNENGNQIHKKIMSTFSGVTRRKNDRYGNKFPLASNGIRAEIQNRKFQEQ